VKEEEEEEEEAVSSRWSFVKPLDAFSYCLQIVKDLVKVKEIAL